jgi:hypothetical protein
VPGEESVSGLSAPVQLSQHHSVAYENALEVKAPSEESVLVNYQLISQQRNIHPAVRLSCNEEPVAFVLGELIKPCFYGLHVILCCLTVCIVVFRIVIY